MAVTKIKVKLSTIKVSATAGLVGPGEWKVNASVLATASGTSTALGPGGDTHEVHNNDTLTLNWEQDIPVQPKDTTFEISVSIVDTAGAAAADMGQVKATINVPILHEYNLLLSSSKSKYAAQISVLILEKSDAAPGAATTILQNSGASTYNTINDEMNSKLVHICPVIPVPWADMPPMAAGVAGLTASPQEVLNATAATAKLNGLVNPSLIPVLDPKDADFADKCARVRITQFRPSTLDKSKFIWKAVTNNIKFRDGATDKTEVKGGMEVNVYGVQEGDVDTDCKIEVHWDGEGTPLLAVFRALVGKPKYVVMRANIIKCSSATDSTGVPILNPTVTSADIKKHVTFSNVLLWQMGVQLVMDTDKTTYPVAGVTVTAAPEEGIFTINSTANYTCNVIKNDSMVAPMLNSRGQVFNLVYMHSCAASPTLLGRATDRRLSEAEALVESKGTPSDSWVFPTGIFPDADAQTIKIKRMAPSNARAAAQKPLCGDQAIDKLSACLITALDNATNGSVTMAHELGHVIGLNHRGDSSRGAGVIDSVDGVNHLAGPNKGRGHPWHENAMTYGTDVQAQDFDIGQTMIVRAHKLVRASLPGVVPPGKKPVPESKLPTEQDRKLLQSYLSGVTPGLKHKGYNIGTSGPNGDGVDGIVGSKTTKAIHDFQRDHGGLVQDGIYGPKTKAAFDEELNGP